MNKKNILDVDPQETQDWIDSINALINERGTERTHFIIEKLINFSRKNGLKIPFSANNPPTYQTKPPEGSG